MPFYDLAARASKELFPGVVTKTFWGDHLLISCVTLDPNAVAPAHSHPHEQAGVVISGILNMTVGDETRALHVGEMYLAPGDVVHSAQAGAEGCVVCEVFSPVREVLQY